MRLTKFTCVLLAAGALISGCSSVKLGEIPKTRENYNLAIDSSENEQFLLNLVRMHYGRSPYFISVDSVTTNTSLSTNVAFDNISNTMGAPGAVPGINWTFRPNMSYTEAPVISYTPLQGSQFISGLLTPMGVDRLGVLANSGWEMSTIMNLAVNRIGNLRNTSISNHYGDKYQQAKDNSFDDFISLMGTLLKTGQIEISRAEYESKPAILFQAKDLAVGRQISNSLSLKNAYTSYIFTNYALGTQDTPENIIPLQTSSLMGVMNEMSLGVRDSESPVMVVPGGNITIFMSKSEPDKAAIKIHYENGNWYYIPKDDEYDNALMVLLKLIYSLELGDIKANLPVVTIPVSAN